MVKRERETFLHISQIRGTIKKFAVVLAFVCAFVFMLLSKSENVLIEKTSGTAGEIVSSAVDVLVMPAAVLVKGYEYLRSLRKIDLENRALREENRRLTIANAESRALLVENVLLRQLLNYTPPPEASFVTARWWRKKAALLLTRSRFIRPAVRWCARDRLSSATRG